jgi:hypothetical protein
MALREANDAHMAFGVLKFTDAPALLEILNLAERYTHSNRSRMTSYRDWNWIRGLTPPGDYFMRSLRFIVKHFHLFV